jgi:DnaJ-domain-containing protein 1
MKKDKTVYEILGVSRTAQQATIRKAYVAKARKLHPDNFRSSAPHELKRSEELMRELNNAWTTVSDPKLRKEYDRKLVQKQKASVKKNFSPSASSYPQDSGIKKTNPSSKYATYDDMKLNGFARVVRPFPLSILLLSVLAVVLVFALVGGSDSDPPTKAKPSPTGIPLICIDITPETVQVPCAPGGYEAVVWEIVGPKESCPDTLLPYYRSGIGGLFCVTLVE